MVASSFNSYTSSLSTLAATPFILPTYPVHSNTSANTGPVIQEANRQYDLDLKEWHVFNDGNKVFGKKIVAATLLAYISELSDPDLGFTNVTSFQLLTYLKENYGTVLLVVHFVPQLQVQ